MHRVNEMNLKPGRDGLQGRNVCQPIDAMGEMDAIGIDPDLLDDATRNAIV
jgi:hypothetical protein